MSRVAWLPKSYSFIDRYPFFLRTAALKEDGKRQILYPKSDAGWLKTIFVVEGRALDKFLLPWLIVTLNAVAWTFIVEYKLPERKNTDFSSYESYFGLVMNSSLAFLLVFRLNRSAERYWSARTSWGIIVALGRTIVGSILVHGQHDPSNRDGVVKWVAAFSVATMHFVRGMTKIAPDSLAGILNESEIEEMETQAHMGLHAATQIRWHLKAAFKIDEMTPYGIAQERIQELYAMEKQLNQMMDQMGALERIRATPLPLVYVTHLRTFLLCFLFAMPYIWESNLGYATIPIVSLTAFALLGLEGAAQEVESPFQKDRANHLSMDSYCLSLIGNTVQQIKYHADRELESAHRPLKERENGRV